MNDLPSDGAGDKGSRQDAEISIGVRGSEIVIYAQAEGADKVAFIAVDHEHAQALIDEIRRAYKEIRSTKENGDGG